MAFRFVHTADLHLDSPLKSLALRNEALARLIDAATRETCARIIDLAATEAVDALLIAGDLYDGANTSMKTAAFLSSELARLPPEIRVFIIKGNHDAQSPITRRLDLRRTFSRSTLAAARTDLRAAMGTPSSSMAQASASAIWRKACCRATARRKMGRSMSA